MHLLTMVLIRVVMFAFAAILIERNFGLSELIRGYVGQSSAAQNAFQARPPMRQILIVIMGIASMILMVGALGGIVDLIMRPEIVGTNPFGLRLLQVALGLGLVGEVMHQLKNSLS